MRIVDKPRSWKEKMLNERTILKSRIFKLIINWLQTLVIQLRYFVKLCKFITRAIKVKGFMCRIMTCFIYIAGGDAVNSLDKFEQLLSIGCKPVSTVKCDKCPTYWQWKHLYTVVCGLILYKDYPILRPPVYMSIFNISLIVRKRQ